MVLHYGQEIFEGLKAYRQPDGGIATFRPEQNARRFQRSADRLAMPELPGETVHSRRSRAGHHRPQPGCPTGRRDEPLPAPVHDRHRGRPGASSRPRTYLSSSSPARPALLLHGRREAGHRVALRGIQPGRARRHRRGQVRRQLRGLPVAQAQAADKGCDQVVWLDAGRAPLGRGDGRDEPLLRPRLGRLREHHDPDADRITAPGRDPRLVAHAGRRPGHFASRRAHHCRRVAGAPIPARSPRCSPAAPLR